MQREGQLQNFQSGQPPDDSGVILRVNPINGSASANNPFVANGDEAGRYYAYGIRNSYGFDFDRQESSGTQKMAKIYSMKLMWLSLDSIVDGNRSWVR